MGRRAERLPCGAFPRARARGKRRTSRTGWGKSEKKGDSIHASEKARFYLLHCKCIFYFKTTVVNSIEHAPPFMGE